MNSAFSTDAQAIWQTNATNFGKLKLISVFVPTSMQMYTFLDEKLLIPRILYINDVNALFFKTAEYWFINYNISLLRPIWTFFFVAKHKKIALFAAFLNHG